MGYDIGTGVIYEKFKVNCECPLCQIKKVAEEKFLHEFLNDAVMEPSVRKKVNEKGFCSKHFDMLYARQNKLSLALQVETRLDMYLLKNISPVNNVKDAKKLAEFIDNANSTCVVCELMEESMKRYYKTIAQMFVNEPDFKTLFINCKGFCTEHYSMLLKYSKYAGFHAKEYLKALSEVEIKNLKRISNDIRTFCNSHDYRNIGKPLGEAETALPRASIKLYGEKDKK